MFPDVRMRSCVVRGSALGHTVDDHVAEPAVLWKEFVESRDVGGESPADFTIRTAP